jgi:uncharacterized protein (TIGR03435 family)
MLPISSILELIHERLHTDIIDKTGLTGNYDFKWELPMATVFTINGRPIGGGSSGSAGTASDPDPDVIGGVEKQLGLKLQKAKARLDVLVIDRIDKAPTEN